MAATLEFMIPRRDSEAFNTAVYRYLELRSTAPETGLVVLDTEPFGHVDRKRLTLWSDDALLEFTSFWSAARRRARARMTSTSA